MRKNYIDLNRKPFICIFDFQTIVLNLKLKGYIMNRIVFVSALCIVFLLPSCKFIRKKGWFGTGKADTMLVWQARQDSIRVADSLFKVRQQLEAIEQARIDSLNRVEQERLAYEARFRYHIVVGSFITPEYAKALNEGMKKQGYNSQIVRRPGSRFEFVSAEAHENLRKAVDRLMQFRDTVAYDAWIYVRK